MRQSFHVITEAYGSHADETVDLVVPEHVAGANLCGLDDIIVAVDAPVVVYLHGGMWQALRWGCCDE